MSNFSKSTTKNQFSRYAAGSSASKISENASTGFENSLRKENIPSGLTNSHVANGIGFGMHRDADFRTTYTKGTRNNGSWMSRKRIGIDDEEIKRDAQRAKLERRKKYQKGDVERLKVIKRQIQQKAYQNLKRAKNKKEKESRKKQQANSSDEEESFVASTTTEEDIILTSSSEEESLSNNMMGGGDDEDHIDSPKPLPVGRMTRNRIAANAASRKLCDSTRKTSVTAALAVDHVREATKEDQKTDRMLLDSSSDDDCHSLLSKPTFILKSFNQRSHLTCSQTKERVASKGKETQANNQSMHRRNKIIHSSSEDDDEYQLNLRRAMKESLSDSKTNFDNNDWPTDIPKYERRALEIALKSSLKDTAETSNLLRPDATQWLLESTSPTAISNFKRLKKKRMSYNENSDGHLSLTDNGGIRQKKMANKMSQQRSSQAADEAQFYCDDNSSDAATITTAHGSDENGNDGVSFQGDEGEDGTNEKDEAATVLDTVNELSSRVLYRMQSFCYQLQDHDNRMPSTVQGMIVDGALAMSSFSSRTHITTKVEDGEAAQDGKALVSREALSKCISPKMVIHDYQLIGVNWMALMNTLECYDKRRGKMGRKREKSNVNGVLADEMGLGKTVQTIAFLAWLKYGDARKRRKENLSIAPSNGGSINLDDSSASDEQAGDDDMESNQPVLSNQATYPHLIVVPASVLSNWMREFEKICPGLVVQIYHGTQEERRDLRSQLRKRPVGSPDIDVILTTFSYFSNEKSDDRKFLGKIKFDYLVVDEAHSLKNPKGKRYQELDRIKTSHRLLLTGTPIQNNPAELLALLCFLMPLFQTRGEDVANDGGVKLLEQLTKSKRSGKNKLPGRLALEDGVYGDLKQLLAPFILRRRKVDVVRQALPPKIHKVEMVPFDECTRNLYDSILRSHISVGNTKKEVDSITADASKCKNIFTLLRKAANHPLLLRTRHKSSEAIEELSNHLFKLGYFGSDKSCTIQLVRSELEGFSDFDIHLATLDILDQFPGMNDSLTKYTLTEEDLFCSPKFKRLKILLPNLIEVGHRVLIFSQWTRCLDLLGCFLESLQMRFLRLDGQTDIGERQRLIDEFNVDTSIPVFLLSTRAGGMGINLTSADTVICHDLDFNPFNDLQAEDRCHRIGQTKQVTVYKMVTEGTVDDDIYAMQKRKSEMTAAIFSHESGNSGVENKAYGKKKASNGPEREDITSIMKVAIDRFLSSPK